MPPKKAGKPASKGKGGKGGSKGKGKGKGGKASKKGKKEAVRKLTKKDKKLIKKFGDLKYEGASGKEEPLIWMKRDELEVVASTLRDQVTLQRKERIRFMLERDFLADCMKTYQEKLRCLQEEEMLMLAEEVKSTQDVADLETIKNMEGKHFRYDVQMRATQMDMKNELRRQKLKDWLDKTWQFIHPELERQAHLLQELSKQNRERIRELKHKLDDLHEFAADHEKQLKEYIVNMKKSLEDALHTFRIQRSLDINDLEERYNEFIWNLGKNYEKFHDQYKQFYIMVTHNCLTLILSMKDEHAEVDTRKAVVLQEISDLKSKIKFFKLISKSTNDAFTVAKVKHIHFDNLKRSIRLTSQDIEKIGAEITKRLQEYRQLNHQMQTLDEDRVHFRSSTSTMAENLLDVYSHKYNIMNSANSLTNERWNRENEKCRLMEKLKDAKDFWPAVAPFMSQLNQKDAQITSQKFKAIRISKQQDDLRNSLEARMLHIGLKTKYKTTLPQQSHVATRSQRLDWGPAGLLAKKQFPVRQQPVRYQPKCIVTEDMDDEVPVCVTESIEKALNLKSTNHK